MSQFQSGINADADQKVGKEAQNFPRVESVRFSERIGSAWSEPREPLRPLKDELNAVLDKYYGRKLNL